MVWHAWERGFFHVINKLSNPELFIYQYTKIGNIDWTNVNSSLVQLGLLKILSISKANMLIG